MPPLTWIQVTDPCHNRPVSLLVALVPVLFIFWALVVRRIKGYLASLFAIVIALAIAVLIYRMPVPLALLSAANGALFGLFPMCWIVLPAVFLYNISVRSGQFNIIRQFLASITADRRIQALLIAFSFGAFLEGTSGFGTPVAITAAMLTGLGFKPLYAAGICLIANTAPVAFGTIGIPIAGTGGQDPALFIGHSSLLPRDPDGGIQKSEGRSSCRARIGTFFRPHPGPDLEFTGPCLAGYPGGYRIDPLFAASASILETRDDLALYRRSG
jgi:hypothetical protein